MPRLTRAIACSVAVLCPTAVTPVPPDSIRDPTFRRVSEHLGRLEPELVAFRRDLHRHPELSGEEARTARAVADRLRAAGLRVRTDVGGHGVVAVLEGGRPGPVVAFRADLDAVASRAPDPVEFRSVIPGVRHICGHDLHTTIGVALGLALAAVRQDLAGTVMLIFQPAEERATGARAMLADGVFLERRPVAIFALHAAPLESGTLAARPGGMMAGRDVVRVALNGGGDLSAAAAVVRRAIEATSTITPARRMESAAPDFVLAEAMPARPLGDGLVVQGTVTVADDAARARVRAAIRAVADTHGVPGVMARVAYESRVVPGVINDPALLALADAAIATALGEGVLREVRTIPPAFSEDFGHFQAEVPGAFWYLGVSNAARGWVGLPHSDDYVADEAAILVGARAMAAAILARLAAGGPGRPTG
jgi:amidohydrolase